MTTPLTACKVAVAVLLVSWGLAAAQAPAPGAVPGAADVSQACTTAAGGLQTSCQAEFSSAQEYFGVSVTNSATATNSNVTAAQINAYAAQAPPPSPGCCKAAKDFNDAYCSCEKAVLNLAEQFTGNDPRIYESIAQGFATACKFPIYINTTCPAS